MRVSPFGAGHEDGFWRHVIGDPWEAKSDSALDALHVLLRGVMMRHSKSQTTLEGTSILSLPAKTISYEPVELHGSERAGYAYLEQLLVSEIKRSRAIPSRGAASGGGGGGANASAAGSTGSVSGAGLLVSGLRLLREASVALQLIGGGAACPDQLKTLEEISRARMRATAHGPSADGSGVDNAEQEDAVQLRRMTPSQVILQLGSTDRQQSEREHGDRFHNAVHHGDMVRHRC